MKYIPNSRLIPTALIIGASLIGGFAVHGYLTRPTEQGRFQITYTAGGYTIMVDSATGQTWEKNVGFEHKKSWFKSPSLNEPEIDLSPLMKPKVDSSSVKKSQIDYGSIEGIKPEIPAH